MAPVVGKVALNSSWRDGMLQVCIQQRRAAKRDISAWTVRQEPPADPGIADRSAVTDSCSRLELKRFRRPKLRRTGGGLSEIRNNINPVAMVTAVSHTQAENNSSCIKNWKKQNKRNNKRRGWLRSLICPELKSVSASRGGESFVLPRLHADQTKPEEVKAFLQNTLTTSRRKLLLHIKAGKPGRRLADPRDAFRAFLVNVSNLWSVLLLLSKSALYRFLFN